MSAPLEESTPQPGGERRRYVLPVAIVAGLLLTVIIWWAASPHGPRPPFLVFENPQLGCRFEYPSSLTAGPNFVRADSGSILTIERHSLEMAKKDWVAGLPDVLFSQVMIQLEENYHDLEETGRTHPLVDGRLAVEIVLRGRIKESGPAAFITILILANEDWVYVLRSYSRETLDAEERPLFRRVRETWKFLGKKAPGTPS